jgi:hypothetical protein
MTTGTTTLKYLRILEKKIEKVEQLVSEMHEARCVLRRHIAQQNRFKSPW